MICSIKNGRLPAWHTHAQVHHVQCSMVEFDAIVFLVGGIPTPLKNMSSSDGVIPNTLWLFNIAMENGPFIEVYLLKMVMFHGYVKQPEGICKNRSHVPNHQPAIVDLSNPYMLCPCDARWCRQFPCFTEKKTCVHHLTGEKNKKKTSCSYHLLGFPSFNWPWFPYVFHNSPMIFDDFPMFFGFQSRLTLGRLCPGHLLWVVAKFLVDQLGLRKKRWKALHIDI